MALQWGVAQQPEAGSAWNDVLRPIGSELELAAPELARAAVARMRELVPGAFTDVTTGEQVRANAETGIRALGSALAQGSDPSAIELPAGLLEGARSRAQTGFTVAPLMRSYRIAHEFVWDWMTTRILEHAEDPPQRQAATALASAWTFAAVDRLATQYAEAYETEHERWRRSAAALRTETIEAILGGNEPDIARASSRMSYELDRHHVGVIAWIYESRDGGQAALRAAVEQLASELQADGTLVEPLGLLATMAWLSRRTAFEDSAVDGLRTLRSPDGTSMAVGEPSSGLAGFRRSQAEAAQARRVAMLVGRHAGSVIRFRDVELTAVATADLDLTRSFVETTLGPLAGEEDSTRRIAATLSVYLQEGCSRTRAAKRLHVHENTIGYRVRQAEGLLGRPVNSDQLRLTVALQLLPAVRDHL